MAGQPHSPKGPTTLVRLGTKLFGFPASDVSEMISLTEVHGIPDAPRTYGACWTFEDK